MTVLRDIARGLRVLKDFDARRPGVPGEHWVAFAAGLAALSAGRQPRAPLPRAALLALGCLLLVRSLSGRDGPLERLRDWRGTSLAERSGEQVTSLRRVTAAPTRDVVPSYPSDLVQRVGWEGRTITVRPIRSDDGSQHVAFLAELSSDDVRMRVFHGRSGISADELERLTHIDYGKEMAFVAVEADVDGRERTLGVARAIARSDPAEAEFGVIVRSDLKGQRLGELLMRRLIAHQRTQGTRKLVGTVLAENTRMMELALRLGFVEQPCAEGAGVRCIELQL